MNTLARLALAATAGFASMLLIGRSSAETVAPSGILDVELRPLFESDTGMRSLRTGSPALIVVLDPRCTHCRAMRDEWTTMFYRSPERVARHLIFTRPDTTGYQGLIERSGARTSWITPQELSRHAGITAVPVTFLLNARGQAVKAAHGTFDASTTESFVRRLAKFR